MSLYRTRYSTGGSIPNLLPQLSPAQLNLTFSVNNTGNMFEKESVFNIDVSGSGGEYTVQAGFGWTNGVALYLASKYGAIISTPNCPPVIVNGTSSNSTNPGNETLSSVVRRGGEGWREKRKMLPKWAFPRAVWNLVGTD
jgi:alpha,alpha-trehalase